MRAAGVFEWPLDSVAGVWLIIDRCCYDASVRAWTNHLLRMENKICMVIIRFLRERLKEKRGKYISKLAAVP